MERREKKKSLLWHPCAYLCQASAKTGKHFPHVSTFLHGNNSKVIFFIDPHKEGLVVVMPEKGGGGEE